jgi:predicted CoA-binding protein
MATQTSQWSAPSARERLGLLEQSKTIAIVGASNNSARASYFVGTYLLSSSNFTVWFVNPRESEILGHTAFASLADLPATPDIVDVFRKPSDLPEVLDQAIAASAKTLWLQLGIEDPAIAQRGHEAGLNVVMNRCLKIEHARFHGGLHLAGFNTGVIRSTRKVT